MFSGVTCAHVQSLVSGGSGPHSPQTAEMGSNKFTDAVVMILPSSFSQSSR